MSKQRDPRRSGNPQRRAAALKAATHKPKRARLSVGRIFVILLVMTVVVGTLAGLIALAAGAVN